MSGVRRDSQRVNYITTAEHLALGRLTGAYRPMAEGSQSAWPNAVQITVVTPPAGNIDPLVKPMARGWSASFNLTYNSQNWRIG